MRKLSQKITQAWMQICTTLQRRFAAVPEESGHTWAVVVTRVLFERRGEYRHEYFLE